MIPKNSSNDLEVVSWYANEIQKTPSYYELSVVESFKMNSIQEMVSGGDTRQALSGAEEASASFVYDGVWYVPGRGLVGRRGIPVHVERLTLTGEDYVHPKYGRMLMGTLIFQSDPRYGYSASVSVALRIAILRDIVIISETFWSMLTEQDQQVYRAGLKAAGWGLSVRSRWTKWFNWF